MSDIATPLKTPQRKNANAINNLSTPLFVPPSPMLQELGYGTGVHVYRIERSMNVGNFRSPWVVKRLRRETAAGGLHDLISSRLKIEADILRHLDHPNIVGYRGSKILPNQQVILAMENCDKSLGDVIEGRSEEALGPLEAIKIKKMSLDVCKALDYLHTKAFILHGDLKSYNVLIKGDFKLCKLCDFGVSQPLNDEGYLDLKKNPSANYTGTNLWSAPEVFSNQPELISSKADIFSFGLVVYECIALRTPHTEHLSIFEDSINPSDEDTSFKQPKKLFNNSQLSESSMETEAAENQSPNVSNLSHISLNTTVESENDMPGDLDTYLGTRPLIPFQYDLSEEYNVVMEVFFVCTSELAENRPSAGYLAKYLETLFSNATK